MEKIRISVSKYTYDILLKDMEYFEIFKPNGEINKNEFLNRLIINYADDFTLDTKEQWDEVIKLVNKYTDLDQYDRANLTGEIISSLKDNFFFRNIDDESKIISLKPTKESSSLIEYLISEEINNQSISSFFREMFDSYVNMVQTMRERIIFEKEFKVISKSLEKNRKVFIKLKNDKSVPIIGSVYAVVDSKEELFNYILLDVNGKIQTIRLARIALVKIMNEPASFNQNILSLMDYQIENGVQFTVSEQDMEVVKVKMTERGLKLYRKMYLYRPNYHQVDGDIFYFKGSHEKIFNYFKRFGKDAIIVHPAYLKERMEHFYKSGWKGYLNIDPID